MMVKLYASLLALTLATSSTLASSQQPRGGINILRRRDLDQEFSRREFFLDARDSDTSSYYDLEARGFFGKKDKGKMKSSKTLNNSPSQENLLQNPEISGSQENLNQGTLGHSGQGSRTTETNPVVPHGHSQQQQSPSRRLSISSESSEVHHDPHSGGHELSRSSSRGNAGKTPTNPAPRQHPEDLKDLDLNSDIESLNSNNANDKSKGGSRFGFLKRVFNRSKGSKPKTKPTGPGTGEYSNIPDS